MNASPLPPSLSLALPVSIVSFSVSSLSPSLSLSTSRFTALPACSAPLSYFATLLFRDLVSARRRSSYFFPFSPDLHARHPRALALARLSLPFRPLYARAFPASPALHFLDRLRIHREIDRPKRVPEWPVYTNTRKLQKEIANRYAGHI